MLEIGTKAPDFSGIGTGNKKVSLKDYKGKYVVLIFYCRNNTPR